MVVAADSATRFCEVKRMWRCRRDVIKAETASLSVPELDLEVTTGVFGGLITTVEGLVAAVRYESTLQRAGTKCCGACRV